MKAGTHFWAKKDGKLVMMMFDGEEYTVCGPWECAVNRDFEVIEIVPIPEGYTANDLYYKSDNAQP